MLMEIERGALPVRAAAAARTVEADIKPILEIADKTGQEIEVMAFIGSSPIRHYVEAWDLSRMTRLVEDSVRLAVDRGLPVTFVTEDTTRSDPGTLETLLKAAMGVGARRLCLCDTVGHATPNGTTTLVRFTRELIAKEGLQDEVGIDWHGHNDRGLGITNTIYAIEAGADRVHGTALGIGERVGNASMELILLNLKLLGLFPDQDISKLPEYSATASRCMRHDIPRNYPIVGRDAFRTATGVHAAAIVKAKKKGDDDLADRIYSGVPASLVGRHQEIEIAHTSGAANVQAWLAARDIPFDDGLIAHILKVAKRGTRVLGEEELRVTIGEYTLGAS
jgi:isopropylmalate/homocitrate/citramalate synthase